MNVKVVLPKSGMGIDEGTILRWLKAEGDRVERGEILVEVETAKAIQEVESPASGILGRILAAEGAVIPVNSEIGEIREAT